MTSDCTLTHGSGSAIRVGLGDGLGLGFGRGLNGIACPDCQAVTDFPSWPSRFSTSRSAFSSVMDWVVSVEKMAASLSFWFASYFTWNTTLPTRPTPCPKEYQ